MDGATEISDIHKLNTNLFFSPPRIKPPDSNVGDLMLLASLKGFYDKMEMCLKSPRNLEPSRDVGMAGIKYQLLLLCSWEVCVLF